MWKFSNHVGYNNYNDLKLVTFIILPNGGKMWKLYKNRLLKTSNKISSLDKTINMQSQIYTLKALSSNLTRMTRKGPIGVKLHSGSTMTQKKKKWRGAGSIWPHHFVKSAESWKNSGSLLTRNLPQWTLFPRHVDPGVLRVYSMIIY